MSEDELEKDLIRYFGKSLLRVNNFRDKLKLNWVNRAAALLANRLNEMLRKPDEIDANRKGHIIWNDVTALFNPSCDKKYLNMTICDRITKVHFIPLLHMDYMSMSINIELQDNIIKNLDQISDSLNYNNENKELTAWSDFPTAIIVQFAIVKRVNNGKINLEDARNIYKIWIKIVYDEWEHILYGEKIENVSILSTVLEKYVLTI